MKRKFNITSIPASRFYGNKKICGSRAPAGTKARSQQIRIRIRSRKRKSFTTTTTTRKKEKVVRPAPGGISHSYTSRKLYPGRYSGVIKALGNSQTYNILNTVPVIALFNQQGTAAVGGLWSQNTLQQLYNNGSKTKSQPSGGMVLQTYQKSWKMHLESAIITCLFTNTSPNGLEVDIYDCVSKVTTSNFIATDQAWNQGLIDQELVATSTSIKAPYCVPTESKLFNVNWRILKRTRVELAAGSSHEHIFYNKINRQVDAEYCVNYAQIKDITYQQLVVVRGVLVDSSPGVTTANNIGFAASKLLCCVREKYIVRQVQSTPRTSFLTNNLTLTDGGHEYTQVYGGGSFVDVLTNTA